MSSTIRLRRSMHPHRCARCSSRHAKNGYINHENLQMHSYFQTALTSPATPIEGHAWMWSTSRSWQPASSLS